MKIKSGFMLREIVDTWVVVPLGERVVEFNGIITLNETGAFLWRGIENGEEVSSIVQAVTREYDVDRETAMNDAIEFISVMAEKGLLVE